MRDEQALADFCREEWPRLVGSLSLFVGSRELAEDLAQETLVRVCDHWRTARAADSPTAWAHRVGFNLAKSHGRRRATWTRVQTKGRHTDGVGRSEDLTKYSGRVEAVRMIDAAHATVDYTLLFGGQAQFGTRTGTAVKIDGAWKVSRDTECALLALGGITCPPRSDA